MAEKTSTAAEAEAFRNGKEVTLFNTSEEDSLTHLTYREVPLPWPFTSRYYFIVQEYRRLLAEDGTKWFFTYNHDASHAYFERRVGFERLRVRVRIVLNSKIIYGLVVFVGGLIILVRFLTLTNQQFQGMVGAPYRSAGATTRLAWLVNVDFGGLVPVAALQVSLGNPKGALITKRFRN